MIKMYPLEWFDSLIVNTFGTYTDSMASISEFDSKVLCENIINESQKIKIQIKVEVFELKSKRQIRLLVRQYHASFVFLLDSIMESRKNERFITSGFGKIFDLIVTALDDLLSFVEIRFSNFMSLDQRVPITYMIVWKTELQTSLEILLKKKGLYEQQNKEFKMVIDLLLSELNGNKKGKFTYRQVLYQRELLRKIEEFDFSKESVVIYTVFDEMLIGANFNCIEYVHYLTERINNTLEKKINLKDRMNELLFFFKEFSQLHCNEKVSFDPRQKNIKDSLNNWFNNEIDYLQRRMELTGDIAIGKSIPKIEEKHELIQNKIECILSSDQIGLILRASDESRILKAKSMNQVFKTIVPHLSTSLKKDLSYASMRSKSYSAEERDKEIAIKTLERIIKHIKEY